MFEGVMEELGHRQLGAGPAHLDIVVSAGPMENRLVTPTDILVKKCLEVGLVNVKYPGWAQFGAQGFAWNTEFLPESTICEIIMTSPRYGHLNRSARLLERDIIR